MKKKIGRKYIEAIKDATAGVVVAIPYLHYKGKIWDHIQNGAPYDDFAATVGTDYFGGISEIQLARSVSHLLGIQNRVFHDYIIPLGVATANTLMEFGDKYGLPNINTQGMANSADLSDISCYWAAALTTILVPKIWEWGKKKFTKKSLEANL